MTGSILSHLKAAGHRYLLGESRQSNNSLEEWPVLEGTACARCLKVSPRPWDFFFQTWKVSLEFLANLQPRLS